MIKSYTAAMVRIPRIAHADALATSMPRGGVSLVRYQVLAVCQFLNWRSSAFIYVHGSPTA